MCAEKLSTIDFSLSLSLSLFLSVKKDKGCRRTGHEGPEERVEAQLYSFFNLSARWGRMVNATPRPLNAWEGDPVPIVQKAGWGLGASLSKHGNNFECM